jgi:UPF0271 protein
MPVSVLEAQVCGMGKTHMPVDLNADMGEGFGPWVMGDDSAMLDIITSANVACGFHAGDPLIMANVAREAQAKGVSIGAHPGFNDLWGFGRRVIRGDSPTDTATMVAYQIGAFQSVAALAGHHVTHVKLHGALSNIAAEDDDLARALAGAIRAVDRDLVFLVMPGTALERAGDAAGLPLAREIFADRTYDDSFNLTSRTIAGAVLHQPDAIVAHVMRMVEEGAIITTSGKRLKVAIDSICVHGDNPQAVAAGAAVRGALTQAGIEVRPFASRKPR